MNNLYEEAKNYKALLKLVEKEESKIENYLISNPLIRLIYRIPIKFVNLYLKLIPTYVSFNIVSLTWPDIDNTTHNRTIYIHSLIKNGEYEYVLDKEFIHEYRSIDEESVLSIAAQHYNSKSSKEILENCPQLIGILNKDKSNFLSPIAEMNPANNYIRDITDVLSEIHKISKHKYDMQFIKMIVSDILISNSALGEIVKSSSWYSYYRSKITKQDLTNFIQNEKIEMNDNIKEIVEKF